MRGSLKERKWRHLVALPSVAPLLFGAVVVAWRVAVAATAPASTSTTNWSWKCENSSVGGHQKEMACLCQGEALMSVPTQLNPAVQRLTMSHTGMEVLQRKALLPYNETLSDVDLVDMLMLSSIEPDTFSTLGKLRAIYIVGAPKLQSLPPGVFSELAPSFRVLRIMQTGLMILPEMNGLGAKSVLHMIDLESNKLERIPSCALQVRAEQLRLDYNVIRVVEAGAFNGSEIAKLSLKGNRRLNQLSLGAFRGLKSISELDLSSTSITRLPTEGLDELDALRVEDTPSLREVPSIYSFKHLRVAQLTYSFHCCAFRFPARHDPERHRAHQLSLSQICNGQAGEEGGEAKHSYQASAGTQVNSWDDQAMGFDYDWKEDSAVGVGVTYWDTGQDHPQRRRRSSTDDLDHPTQFVDSFGEIMADDGFQQHYERPTIGGNDIPPLWHKAVTPPRSVHALCGNLSVGHVEVHCTPTPDALNPCEDIMGYAWLRVFVWAVVAATVAGNLAVLTVLLANIAALTVPKFLMCHLALADLCMGLYLLLLAAMDLRSSGEYFNFACAWQIEVGCNVAGFLTVFSSQLSIFTLCVITLERWFAITYAIDLNKRLRLGAAAHVMTAGWVYALTMAALPLAGVSSYSSTSICLPMDTTGVAGLSYLVFLLLMAGLAFAVVLICYLQIYLSLGPETRRRTTRRRPQPLTCSPTTASTVPSISKASRTELSVANKMALLVFTDFTCWAPIAFFSLTALAGHPLISVTNSKILLVFFYPLNACANPFLYAILTAQYRRDLCLLLARYGLCTRLAQRYKMAAHSSPTTNNSHQPLPLAGRGDGCMEYRSSLVSGSLIGGMPTATRTSRLLSLDQDSRDEAFV